MVALVLVDMFVNIVLVESLRMRDKELYIELKSPSALFNLNPFKLFDFAYFFILPGQYEKYSISDISNRLFRLRRFLIRIFTILFVGWFLILSPLYIFGQ